MNPWVIAFPYLMYLGSLSMHFNSPRIDNKTQDSHRQRSDGRLDRLLGCERQTGRRQRVAVHFTLLLDFAFAQHHPHPHDYHPTRSVSQEHPHCAGEDWSWRIVQGHHHHAH